MIGPEPQPIVKVPNARIPDAPSTCGRKGPRRGKSQILKLTPSKYRCKLQICTADVKCYIFWDDLKKLWHFFILNELWWKTWFVTWPCFIPCLYSRGSEAGVTVALLLERAHLFILFYSFARVYFFFNVDDFDTNE